MGHRQYFLAMSQKLLVWKYKRPTTGIEFDIIHRPEVQFPQRKCCLIETGSQPPPPQARRLEQFRMGRGKVFNSSTLSTFWCRLYSFITSLGFSHLQILPTSSRKFAKSVSPDLASVCKEWITLSWKADVFGFRWLLAAKGRHGFFFYTTLQMNRPCRYSIVTGMNDIMGAAIVCVSFL